MSRIPPDHVARRVLAEAEALDEPSSDHPDERALFYLVKRNRCPLADVALAHEVWSTDEFRHPVEALLLGKATDDEVVAALDLPATTVPAYRHLFFDRGVFRHALDVRRYVRELDVPDEVRRLYVTSVEQGPSFLANRLRVGERARVDPREAVKTVLGDMYDRFLTHRGQALTSEIAREALRWGQAAVATAGVAIDKGGEEKRNALVELRLALKTVDLTETPDEAGVKPEEVLT